MVSTSLLLYEALCRGNLFNLRAPLSRLFLRLLCLFLGFKKGGDVVAKEVGLRGEQPMRLPQLLEQLSHLLYRLVFVDFSYQQEDQRAEIGREPRQILRLEDEQPQGLFLWHARGLSLLSSQLHPPLKKWPSLYSRLNQKGRADYYVD